MPMAEFQALVTEANKEIFEINVSDLKRMLESREDFCLIGVRTKRERDFSGRRVQRMEGTE